MGFLNTLSLVFIMEWLLSNMYIHHTWYKAMMYHEAGVLTTILHWFLISQGSDGQHLLLVKWATIVKQTFCYSTASLNQSRVGL